MTSTVSGENEFESLEIPHLKTHLNAKCNTFKKSARKEAFDHCEEANENIFCQFAHDSAVSLNK